MALTDTTVAKTAWDKNSPIQRLTSISSDFFYTDTTVILITLILLFPDLLLHRHYGMSCGCWPCMVHCECWSSIFDRISFTSWIRLFEPRIIFVWYFSPLIAASRVSPLSLSFCTVANILRVFHFGKSMLQSKENLCLFVSCFYLFGEPLTHGLTQCLLV